MRKPCIASSQPSLACVALAAALRAQQPIVLQWQTANLTEAQYEPVWKATIAEFEAANPGIKIEPVLVARKDHWTKFVAAAQAKKAPCIVTGGPHHRGVQRLPAAARQVLERRARGLPRAPGTPDMLSASKWKGQLYGLPIWGGTYAEIYNRDLVTRAGLDPSKPPKTWDGVPRLGEEAHRQRPVGHGVLGGKTDTTTRVLLMWIWSNGGEAFNADMTEATFAKNPKSLEAIKFYLGLVAAGRGGAGATTTNYLEQTNLFAQGKIATMRNAYWAVAKVMGDNPAMKGKLFVAPGPANVPNAPTLATVAASSHLGELPESGSGLEVHQVRRRARNGRSSARRSPTGCRMRNDMADDPAIKADPLLRSSCRSATTRAATRCRRRSGRTSPPTTSSTRCRRALLAPDKTEEIFRELDARLDQEAEGPLTRPSTVPHQRERRCRRVSGA